MATDMEDNYKKGMGIILPQNDENPPCSICCDNVYRRIMICHCCFNWICRKCYLDNFNSQRYLQYQWGDFDALNKPITCAYCRQNYNRPLRGIIFQNQPYILTKRIDDINEINNHSIPLELFENQEKINYIINNFFQEGRLEDISMLFGD